MTKTLDDFIKGGYEQLNWPKDGIAKIQYLGQEITETNWGERVKLAVYDLTELKETSIFTASAKLLRLLFKELEVKENDKIAIKRTGEGFSTKYEAKIISRANEKELDKEKVITAKDEPF